MDHYKEWKVYKQCFPVVFTDAKIVLVVKTELDHVVVELQPQLVVLRVIEELGGDLLRDDLGSDVVLVHTNISFSAKSDY